MSETLRKKQIVITAQANEFIFSQTIPVQKIRKAHRIMKGLGL